MSKIEKSDYAPEGTVVTPLPDGTEFRVDGRGRNTDDPAAIDAALHSPYLEVAPDNSTLESFAKDNAAYAQGRDPEQVALITKALDDATDPIVREVAADPATAIDAVRSDN